MPRIGIGKPIRLTCQSLLLCLSTILMLSGCSDATRPTPTSTVAPEQQEQADLDMKVILREFLESLPANWNLTTPEELARMETFVVDVREPEEYAEGFIDGAVSIPVRELARSLQALPAMDKDIVAVCSNGHRSAVGMVVLQMLGYERAKSLDGGMQAWQQANLSVVSAPVPPRPAGPEPEVDSRLQEALDYYLGYTLPFDWGTIDAAGLTEDQNRKSSTELDPQAETFDQGRSAIVDVDDPVEFAKANLPKAINVPLRGLADSLDNMPLEEQIHWA